MRKRSHSHFPLRLFALTTIIIALHLAVGAPAARSSWWQKGLEKLKGTPDSSVQQALTSEDIGAGLKEALLVGSQNVVSQLGREDGFNLDTAVHIPLPQQLGKVQSLLDKIGMASLADDLELKLNRAAEVATPKAKELFAQAIREMTFEDARQIYTGPEDGATRYFQDKMTPALAREMQPVVEQSLSEVGAVQTYDTVMLEYRAIPFVPDVKADLTSYVVDKGMEGIFHYMAIEEAAIRRNPVKRTTELLRRVFGAK